MARNAFVVDFQQKGFDEIERALKNFPDLIEDEIGKVATRVGLMAEGIVIKGINDGTYLVPNSPATIGIKGSSRPLVDDGDLLRSVTHEIKKWHTVHVGVMKNREVKDWDTGKTEDIVNIAWILHQGAVVTVTPKMRKFFFAMSRKHPDKWRPLSLSTLVLVIPPRPFMEVLNASPNVRRINKEWLVGVESVLKIIASKGA